MSEEGIKFIIDFIDSFELENKYVFKWIRVMVIDPKVYVKKP